MGFSSRTVAVASCLALLPLGLSAGVMQVPAEQWAAADCTAQKTFTTSTRAAAVTPDGHQGYQAVQEELSNPGDLAATKSRVVAFFDAATAAAATLVSGVRNAGVPKITNGDKIEQTVVTAAQTTEAVLAGDKKKAGGLSTTSNSAFKAAGNQIPNDFSKLHFLDLKTQTMIDGLDRDLQVSPLLHACSSGGITAPPPPPGGRPVVSPDAARSGAKWVRAVCAAEQAARSAAADKIKGAEAASKAGDLAGAKVAFVAFVDTLAGQTSKLLSSVKKASVPRVPLGDRIAQTYVAALQAILQALPGIKAQTQAVPTNDKNAFKTAAGAITAQFLNVAQPADQQVQTLDSANLAPQLRDCGGVFAASSVLPGNDQGGRPPPPPGG